MVFKSSQICVFIFALFIFEFGPAFSQGNLQFNQVKLISAVETVPAGKVWKMENFMPSVQLATDLTRPSNVETAGGTRNFIMLVNGSQVFLKTTITREVGRADSYWNHSGYVSAADFKTMDGPYWFPSGFSVSASTNVLYLNVIEFNVVP